MLVLRLEYEPAEGNTDLSLPWSITLEFPSNKFSAANFDAEVQEYLNAHGYAPILTNTKGIMPHLHGAILQGFDGEDEDDSEYGNAYEYHGPVNI